MALNPSTNTTMAGRVTAPDANYPYGSSKDETAAGAGDGCPYFKARADDVFGLQQALLNEANIVPSGNAETVLLSQYKDAIKVIIGGAGLYQNDINYPVYSYAKGSDGEIYRAIAANGPASSVVDPVIDGPVGTTWVQAGYQRIVTFTASGTYNKPGGLKFADTIAVGGGAGGGGVDGQGAATFAASGGGGAGAFSRSLLLASSIASSETVTVGIGGTGGTGPGGSGATGGTSSFGSLVSAVGGNGGVGLVGQALQRTTLGGAGGAGSLGVGDQTFSGGSGTAGMSLGYTSNTQTLGGVGGDSFFAGGGRPGLSPSTGINGGAPGAGGSGASVYATTTDYAGGGGADGIVIVREFF